MRYYRLDGRTPVPTDDIRSAFAGNRHVAEDFVGAARISTVFLGIDHGFGQGGGPVLFETMVFGGPMDDYQDRYRTWEEAEAGHAKALEMVRAANAAGFAE